MASLQASVDKLAASFDRLAERLETLETNGGTGYSDTDKVARHVRRYMPFYALGAIFALILLILPSRPAGQQSSEAGALTEGSEGFGDDIAGGAPGSEGPGGTNGGEDGGGGGGRDGSTVGPGGVPNIPGVPKFDPLAWTATGMTRGGFECKKGVRQLPWSRYAVPCYPAWSGNNGGATHRGVTAKTITIVERVFPESANSRAVDAVVQQAGFASQDEREATRRDFEKYFNKVFELWGRQVKVIKYESENGNSTDEALSKGKPEACADASSIIDKYKPFAVIGSGATAVFGECAAERKLTVFGVGAYYPETWYRKYHPYLWNSVMECERIAYMNAEYIGKRLANRPAKWSRDVLLDKSKRRIGLIVPDNDQYQHCVNIAEREGKEKYNNSLADRYNYQLDINRFPEEAANAITSFRDKDVTTVFLACDPIIPIFLTQYARGQEYYPEWIINSAGLTDVEQFARLWDQQSIQWSLFGMSQLGNIERILGPTGEGTVTYKKATGQNIPAGAQVEYYSTLGLFTALQAAGPVLTPHAIPNALWRLPPGGAPEYEVGRSSFLTDPRGRPGRDHTGVDDMREVYWLCTNIGGGDAAGTSRCQEPKGYDDKGGTYKATYGGKRFLPGQWPRGEPPVFPEKK